MSDIQRLIAWHQAMADEPKRNQAKRAKHLATVSALSQAEANRVDADRYRWLRDLPAGSEHEQIGNFPGDWWDEAIDAARLTKEQP